MRITRDAWAMELAVVTARRSTCLRRHVGCVLLSARGHVLATGYNGVAAGQPHCNDLLLTPFDPDDVYPHACPGANMPSGTGLDLCHAIHAEQNAMLQCKDVYAIEACYCTASPCITCIKLLLNTSCQKIYFMDAYPHPDAEKLWLDAGRKWIHYSTSDS